MSIMLGNITFDQVLAKLGYTLTEEDRIVWNNFHSNSADLSGKESCFHVFDMPRCITCKGEDAKKAVLQIFTQDKLTNPMGSFRVYESK